MTLITARNAARENMDKHLSATRDPALYNISVALYHIAGALADMDKEVGQLKTQLTRVEQAQRRAR